MHWNFRDTKSLFFSQDKSTELAPGILCYGSPWQPEFCDWAFNVKRGEDILEKWNLIPETVDVLVTHGPPFGKIYLNN